MLPGELLSTRANYADPTGLAAWKSSASPSSNTKLAYLDGYYSYEPQPVETVENPNDGVATRSFRVSRQWLLTPNDAFTLEACQDESENVCSVLSRSNH